MDLYKELEEKRQYYIKLLSKTDLVISDVYHQIESYGDKNMPANIAFPESDK